MTGTCLRAGLVRGACRGDRGAAAGSFRVFREEPVVLRAVEANPLVLADLVLPDAVDLVEEVREDGEKLGGIWDSAGVGLDCLRCDRL